MTESTGLPGLFITGTDTGIGKTWVTAGIARWLRQKGRRPGVIKPVATGLADPSAPDSDAAIVLHAGGWPVTPESIALANPIHFLAPAAPTVSARAEGKSCEWSVVVEAVHRSMLGWAKLGADVLLIEGAGGVCCPLAEGGKTMLELILTLDFPAIVVARKSLGTLNHTISAVRLLSAGPTRIAGVVLNCLPEEDPNGLAERTAASELALHIAPVPVLHDGPAAFERVPWADLPARARW